MKVHEYIRDSSAKFFYIFLDSRTTFNKKYCNDISTRVSHDLHNYANYRSKNQEIDRLIKRGIIFVTVSL